MLEQIQDREYTWQQLKLIQGYEVMAQSLKEDLVNDPEFSLELSELIHNPEISYEEALRHYFFESGRNLPTLIESPFIKAFEKTSQCREEEAQLISRLKVMISSGANITQSEQDEFNTWLDSRIKLIAKGFQRFVLTGELIEPLATKEVKDKQSRNLIGWMRDHPEEFRNHQEKASRAALEVNGPRVYTAELRHQIQKWFDKGHNIETVTELLRGVGVFVTHNSLKHAVDNYDDLRYKHAEIRQEIIDGLKDAAREIYDLTRSRKRTIQILKKLGFPESRTRGILRAFSDREKIDWNSVITLEDSQITLKNALISFTTSASTQRLEYFNFMEYLQRNGVEMAITYSKYIDARRRFCKR